MAQSSVNPGGRLPRLYGALMPVLAWILFSALYFGFSKAFPGDASQVGSAGWIDLFKKYSPFAGAAFGLISLLGMYILYLFRALFRLSRARAATPIILMLGYAPWAALGYQLFYREPRYATIAKAIIVFGSQPLLYAGAAMAALGLLWLLLTLFTKSSVK